MVRVGAIDIGTNSVRLLVADTDESAATTAPAPLRAVERLMRITRLGAGVHADRRLQPDAIDRTLTVLREYRGVMDELGVERTRASATSAARDAGNRDEFFAAATEVLGFAPQVITGTEEAELSFRGATLGLPDLPSPHLVVDIGGGSTEFVVGTGHAEGLISVDVGCVRISEQFLHSDPPAPEELSNAIAHVRDHLADVLREVPAVSEAASLIGVAGTVSSTAMVEQGLSEYDRERVHHFRLERAAVEDVFRTLATESVEQRRHNPGLEPGRVDVIVGGLVVLATVLRTLRFDSLLVSESDILDGLALSLA